MNFTLYCSLKCCLVAAVHAAGGLHSLVDDVERHQADAGTHVDAGVKKVFGVKRTARVRVAKRQLTDQQKHHAEGKDCRRQ